jgi:hypothetical protein
VSEEFLKNINIMADGKDIEIAIYRAGERFFAQCPYPAKETAGADKLMPVRSEHCLSDMEAIKNMREKLKEIFLKQSYEEI